MTTLTGPAYPPPPAPGSNAIGSFEIGVSPVGTIEPFDFWDTVLSQYANSPNLIAILSAFAQGVDQTSNFDNFYTNIWNLPTATGYGLDLWGRILGISRSVPVDTAIGYFAFDDPVYGFDNPGAPMVTPTSPATLTRQITLGDTDYKYLLMAKAALNIGQGTSAGIMNVLNTFFNEYESGVFTSEMNWPGPLTFNVCQSGNTLSPTNLSILCILAIRPPGCSVNYTVTTGNGPLFGFDVENSYLSGFDAGYIDATPSAYLLTAQTNVSLPSFISLIGGLSYTLNGGVIMVSGPLSATASNLGLISDGGVLSMASTPTSGWLAFLPTVSPQAGSNFVWLNGNVFEVAVGSSPIIPGSGGTGGTVGTPPDPNMALYDAVTGLPFGTGGTGGTSTGDPNAGLYDSTIGEPL